MAIEDCHHHHHPHLPSALQRIAPHKVSTHPVYAPHSEAKQSLLDVIYAVYYRVFTLA